MKRTVLFFVFGIALSTQCLLAQVPSYVPTNGLVGYWPFNGNADDASGNGNNGIVTGATLTTDRAQNSNSCYNFNINNWTWGSGGDEIYIPYNNSFNTENITVSTWFMKTSIGVQNEGSMIINRFQYGYSSPNGQTWYTSLPYGNNTSISTAIMQASNQNNQQVISATGSQIALNTWYHLVFTFDGQELKQYINGVLMTSNSLPGFTLNTAGNSGISIGVSDQANGHWGAFGGKIDDIGIWNRALTQQEITTMYNSVEVPTYSDTCNNVSGSLTQGLVGYWPFCGNANDDSGHGNNGTVNGNVQLTTDRFGNSNSAYIWQSPNFNSNDYIQLGNLNNQLSNKITLSCWVLLNCSQSNNRIISTGEQGLIVYQVQNDNILLKASFDPAGAIWPSNHIVNKNEWHHVVFTADNNLNFSRFYVDGVLTDSSTGANGSISNALWNIGRKSISSFDGFCGKIDDVGIWNRALSQNEVTQLYNQNQCFTITTVTDTLVINVGQLSYTNPVAYANNITIFPNPTSTQVNISFNNITDLTGGNINIINSLGQQVATTPITLSGSSTTMSLDTWGGSGLYFVQILNAQGQTLDIKKIILQ